jgi:hypothetical protein
MEQFILTAEIITLSNGDYNIIAVPNEAIHNYIHTYRFVENSSLNQTLIDDFISEQTPIVFLKLKEYYPDIAINYYL